MYPIMINDNRTNVNPSTPPAPPKPRALPVLFDAIPAELRDKAQWVLWRYTLREGKWTKPPYNVHTGALGDSTDPATWGTFAAARAAYESGGWDGIGFAHLPEDELVGIDLDHCRDLATGIIQPWAMDIVGRLDTWTTLSASGTGLRAYARGGKPGRRCKKGDLEMYDGLTAEGKPGGRYLTITGHHLPGSPTTIHARRQQIDTLYHATFGPEQEVPGTEDDSAAAAFLDGLEGERTEPPTPNGKPLTDEELLASAMNAKNGDKFRRLWDGDTSGYASPSEADLALCDLLGWWTNRDRERVERLFGQSGLGRRAKWTGRADYRKRTLDRALNGTPAPAVNGAGGAPAASSGPGNPSPKGPGAGKNRQSGYEIILEWFREFYKPSFRRGSALYSESLGREVRQGEALAGAPIDLIERLKNAWDAPKEEKGSRRVKRAALPQFFNTWSRSAWVDLLGELKSEGQVSLVGSAAAEDLRTQLADALHTMVTLGRHIRGGYEAQQERRSLIDFAALWATAKWESVRSFQLWMKTGARKNLRVAIRAELFGQLPSRSPLAGISQTMLTQRCQALGLGKAKKVCGKQAVELNRSFVRSIRNRIHRQSGGTGATQGGNSTQKGSATQAGNTTQGRAP
jgi:putative DNA primase/helicase